MTLAPEAPWEVANLHVMQPPPPVDQDLWTSDELGQRWGISRAWLHKLRGAGSHLQPPLPDGKTIRGGMVWTRAQVEAFEAAHPEWASPEAVEARRVSQRGKRPEPE